MTRAGALAAWLTAATGQPVVVHRIEPRDATCDGDITAAVVSSPGHFRPTRLEWNEATREWVTL